MTDRNPFRTTRSELLLAGGLGASLFVLAVVAGPMIGVGVVFGAALAAAVFLQPIIGLGLMVLAGTALQVLGSEHFTGLPLSLGKLVGMLTLLAWFVRTVKRRLPLTYSPQLPALILFGFALCLSDMKGAHGA